MTNLQTMRGGVIGAFLTLVAIAAVAVVVFVAVDILLLGSTNLNRMTGQSSSLFASAQDEQAISAADAVRMGREEAERVAAGVARDAARQAARSTIAERTGEAAPDGVVKADSPSPALNTLSGSQQIAAREAKRVAERIADQIARDIATDELMAYVDSVTGYAGESASDDAPADEDQQASADETSADEPVETVATPEPSPRPAPPKPKASAPPAPTATASSANRPAQPERSAPARRPAPKPSALDLKPWWPNPAPAGQLSLRFAGQAQSDSHGIALLFTAPPASLDAVASQVRVLNDSGEAIEVSWSSGRNPALVQTTALPAGRYVVIINQGLRSETGEAMPRKLEGPVFVRP